MVYKFTYNACGVTLVVITQDQWYVEVCWCCGCRLHELALSYPCTMQEWKHIHVPMSITSFGCNVFYGSCDEPVWMHSQCRNNKI